MLNQKYPDLAKISPEVFAGCWEYRSIFPADILANYPEIAHKARLVFHVANANNELNSIDAYCPGAVALNLSKEELGQTIALLSELHAQMTASHGGINGSGSRSPMSEM